MSLRYLRVLLEAGCRIRFIQEMLSHWNLESTKVYTQIAVSQLKAIHQKYHPSNHQAGPADAAYWRGQRHLESLNSEIVSC